MKKKALILLTATLVCTAIFTSCAKSGPGTAKDGNEVTIETAAIKLLNGTNEGGYGIISTEELKKKVDAAEKMTIIDTNPADSYKSGRVPGAVNAEIPKTVMADVTAEQRSAFVALLPADKNEMVITYCGFTSCQRSHISAVIAIEEGYTNVHRYPGGIVAWKDAAYKVEK